MTPTVTYGAYIEVKKLTTAVMISCLCYFFQHCICEESDRLACNQPHSSANFTSGKYENK